MEMRCSDVLREDPVRRIRTRGRTRNIDAADWGGSVPRARMIGLQITMAPLLLERRYQPLFDDCLFVEQVYGRLRGAGHVFPDVDEVCVMWSVYVSKTKHQLIKKMIDPGCRGSRNATRRTNSNE